MKYNFSNYILLKFKNKEYKETITLAKIYFTYYTDSNKPVILSENYVNNFDKLDVYINYMMELITDKKTFDKITNSIELSMKDLHENEKEALIVSYTITHIEHVCNFLPYHEGKFFIDVEKPEPKVMIDIDKDSKEKAFIMESKIDNVVKTRDKVVLIESNNEPIIEVVVKNDDPRNLCKDERFSITLTYLSTMKPEFININVGFEELIKTIITKKNKIKRSQNDICWEISGYLKTKLDIETYDIEVCDKHKWDEINDFFKMK